MWKGTLSGPLQLASTLVNVVLKDTRIDASLLIIPVRAAPAQCFESGFPGFWVRWAGRRPGIGWQSRGPMGDRVGMPQGGPLGV